MNGTFAEAEQSDLWLDWLVRKRQAGNAKLGAAIRAKTERYADRVLDGAQLRPDMTMADIGAGEGHMAFRAAWRVGPSLQLILADISRPLLRRAEAEAKRRGVLSQCRFEWCDATRLAPIADASVDAATTRAVLAYVADKQTAFRELFRILKPGGRLSLAEPVWRDEALAAKALRMVIEEQGAEGDRFMPLLHRLKSAQFPDTDEAIAGHALVNYSERDLVGLAARAGFTAVHLEFHIDVHPPLLKSWEEFLDCAPHPWAPTPREVLAERFNQEEARFFEQVFRPVVENSSSTIDRVVYLTAEKPGPQETSFARE